MTGDSDKSETKVTAHQPVVLVVEDEPLLRNTTAEYLRLSGYAVTEAADAAEAVAVFAAGEQVDVVFSDIHLAGSMDGLKLARWVHRHHRDIPVMLTSGYGDAARTAEVVGPESFASKPYSQKDIARRIRLLLEEAENRVS